MRTENLERDAKSAMVPLYANPALCVVQKGDCNGTTVIVPYLDRYTELLQIMNVKWREAQEKSGRYQN